MHIFWARLASFGHLGLISDPLIVSKFHNETHDPKGQENKDYTIVKGREMFYRRHTVPVTSCTEVKYVLKGVKFYGKCLPINDSKLDGGLYNAFLCLIKSMSKVSDPGPDGSLVTSLVWCCLDSNLGRPTLKAKLYQLRSPILLC